MILADSHNDSLSCAAEKSRPLLCPHNFSNRHRQLQMTALFCEHMGTDQKASRLWTLRCINGFQTAMEKECDLVMQVKSYRDIESAFRLGKHAALLTAEGSSCFIASKKDLLLLYGAGVRVLGLVWSSGRLAKSNRLTEGETDTGLTEWGRKILREGNRLGMLFDVSHLSDQSFWDVAAMAEKPLLATHSNFRALCGHSRNLTDAMAKHLAESDGMIGFNLYPEFIHAEPTKQTVEGFLCHLEYGLERFGEDHIGFGCDIDGFDLPYPSPLCTSRSIHDQLIEHMEKRGFSQGVIRKVAGENLLRFLKKYL